MKVVLAYSGGLDTSATIVWLKEVYGADQVIAALVDVGQKDVSDGLLERAKALGADHAVLVDQKRTFAESGLAPLIKTGAVYEDGYLLGTAIARPFIAEAMVETALKFGADAICHGATGKGNDYLRFEQRIKVLAPQLKIISSWREWGCNDRAEALAMVEGKGVDFPAKIFDFSVDENLWHSSYEGGCLEHQSQALPEFFLDKMKPKDVVEVTLNWENGLPVSLNGREMPLCDLVDCLNYLLGDTGYGWLDIMETRTNGLKSRGIYHTPGGSLIYQARTSLNQMMFSKPTLDFLKHMSTVYGKMLYQGIWGHPVQKAIEAAVNSIYQGTSGQVKLRVSGAGAIICAKQSQPCLFAPELGGFGNMTEWNDAWSEALVFFQHLQNFSLPFGVVQQKEEALV